jgi:hypothetical protein
MLSKPNIKFSLFFKDKNMKVFSKHIKSLAELLLYKNYKRMSRRFLILFTIMTVLLSIEGKTQQNFRFGIVCGSSFSKVILRYPQNSSAKVGIYPKAICRLPMKKGFWLQTEVGLTDNGNITKYKNDSIIQTIKEARYFVQFTEMAGFSLNLNQTKTITLNIEAGPFFGYYLGSIDKTKTENLNGQTIFEDRNTVNKSQGFPYLRKYSAGLSSGIGVSKNMKNSTILFDLRYDISLTKITEDMDFPELPGLDKNYYQLFSISLGYLFGQNKW